MMRLDRQIFKQLSDIRREIRELGQAAGHAEKRIGALRRTARDPGSACCHFQKLYELQKKKALMERKQTELVRLERKAEEYIQSVPDSGLRRILRYRYMEDLNWQQVAQRMGHRYSAESCRKRAERFMLHE